MDDLTYALNGEFIESTLTDSDSMISTLRLPRDRPYLTREEFGQILKWLAPPDNVIPMEPEKAEREQ
jgi:hypothetical protein